MIKVGLTGGIGCGKSTVTDAFARKGILIIDADKIAHTIVKPNTEALNEISATFGHSLQQDGSLDRVALKKLVFSDTHKLKQLEAILHPKIHLEIKNKLQHSTESAGSPYIIADIPLLIEKNYVDLFDQIIVVDCLPEQQIQRVQQRDGTDIKIIQSIMDKQLSRTQRLKYATHILDNSG
ncbi:MAG: dephospho-CoA kinase, partial [Cocleimonas sp.]|nr:dephospho-CoA kinase [Cocleimonas sp.]